MILIIFSICALALLYAAITYYRNRFPQQEDRVGESTVARTDTAECCGQHEICERDSLMTAAIKKPDYYDDEELDRFQGVAPDAYTAEAVEEFREVLYTLRETEVSSWLHSLQLRNIKLPDSLTDEARLILSEQRYNPERHV